MKVLYILMCVWVCNQQKHNTHTHNPTRRTGSYFGEIALFTSKARTANVRAVTDVVVRPLYKDQCDEVRGGGGANGHGV